MKDRYQIEIYSAGNIDNSPENRYRLYKNAIQQAKRLTVRLQALINHDRMQPIMQVKIYDALRDKIVWDSKEITFDLTVKIS